MFDCLSHEHIRKEFALFDVCIDNALAALSYLWLIHLMRVCDERCLLSRIFAESAIIAGVKNEYILIRAERAIETILFLLVSISEPL